MNGSGPEVLKRWHVYAALFAIFLAASRIVFSAGGTDARTEEQLNMLRQRISQDEQDFARKDVLEQRLKSIEESQKKQEGSLDRQTQTLNEIAIQIRRH